jgi:uncharacterized membrane protein
MSGSPNHGKTGSNVEWGGESVLVVLIGVLAGASPVLIFLFMSDVQVNLVLSDGTRPVISADSSGIEVDASLFNMKV